MAALGSSHMFNDQYLDKEENGKIMVSWSFLGVVFFSLKTPCWIFTMFAKHSRLSFILEQDSCEMDSVWGF